MAGSFHFRHKRNTAPRPPLAPRQEQIAGLMARGLSDCQIAEEMGLSVGTIKVYNSQMYSRVGVAGRIALVNWFLTRYQKGSMLLAPANGDVRTSCFE